MLARRVALKSGTCQHWVSLSHAGRSPGGPRCGGPAGTPGSQLQEGGEHRCPSGAQDVAAPLTSIKLSEFQERKPDEPFSSLHLQGTGT